MTDPSTNACYSGELVLSVMSTCDFSLGWIDNGIMVLADLPDVTRKQFTNVCILLCHVSACSHLRFTRSGICEAKFGLRILAHDEPALFRIVTAEHMLYLNLPLS